MQTVKVTGFLGAFAVLAYAGYCLGHCLATGEAQMAFMLLKDVCWFNS